MDANLIWVVGGVPTVLALLFLVLWLRARGGGGDQAKQLRAAENEVRLLKGDAIQAKRDHANEIGRLTKELETLRAVAEGRVPPELEEWKQRALQAENKLETQKEQHRAEIEKVVAAVGAGGGAGGVDQTMIAPGGVRERMEALERELAQTREELAAAASRHQGEIEALADRLNAEKAAALTAQARRHAAELEARGQTPTAASDRPPAEAPAWSVDAPDSARFAFLEVVAGTGQGTRYFLPYDVATLGRAENSTVALSEEGMASRNHAEIRFNGIDFTLIDLNSTNGTMLNQELITHQRLEFGDTIQIGETQLRFSCEAAEVAASDPGRAARAFEAMVEAAPRQRSALRGLGELLRHDPSRQDDVAAISDRLAALDRGG